MSVHLLTPFLNDELSWIQRLEWLRHKKLFTMGPVSFRHLRIHCKATRNDRGRGPPLLVS